MIVYLAAVFLEKLERPFVFYSDPGMREDFQRAAVNSLNLLFIQHFQWFEVPLKCLHYCAFPASSAALIER
jgi:hypothetical protein